MVEKKLLKEVTMGKMAGQFETIPFHILRVSPVVIFTKKECDIRLIHHLSNPEFDSVNYFFDQEICTAI